jgi:hypothetical protein
MARIMIVVLSRLAAGLSLAGGLKNTLKRGRAGGGTRRNQLFEVRMASVSARQRSDSALGGRRKNGLPLSVTCGNAHVEPRQPD